MNEKNTKIIEIVDDREALMKAADAAVEVLCEERNFNIEGEEKAVLQITYDVIRAILKQASEESKKNGGKDVVYNFMGLLEIGVSVRENDDSEKTGNIVPVFNPGQIAKITVKSDDFTEMDV